MKYFVTKDGKNWGPYSEAEVRQHVESGVFSLDDGIWREGLAEWVPIGQLLDFPQTGPPPPLPPVPKARNGRKKRKSLGCSGCLTLIIAFVLFSAVLSLFSEKYGEQSPSTNPATATSPGQNTASPKESEELAVSETVKGKVGDSYPSLQTRHGQTYSDVIVKQIEPTGLRITHSTGAALVRFNELSEELQRKYGFDPNEPPPRIDYEIYETWRIPNGGYGKAIVIDPANANREALELLVENLKDDVRGDRNAFIFIFTTKEAAAMRHRLEGLTEAERSSYRRAFVGKYFKNANTNLDEAEIHPLGIDGPSDMKSF